MQEVDQKMLDKKLFNLSFSCSSALNDVDLVDWAPSVNGQHM